MVESQGQQVVMVDMVYEELSIIGLSQEGAWLNEGDVPIEDVSFKGSGIVVSGNGFICPMWARM